MVELATAPSPAPAETPIERHSRPLPTQRARRRYILIVVALVALSVVFAIGLLVWDNPVPYGTPGFWRIARRRAVSLVVMGVVAVSQAFATVSFQTATHNRIITPSIMGFESLYVAIQTAAVYFFGVVGLATLQGRQQFVFQVILLVAVAFLLYGTLLSGRLGTDVQTMLLIGIVIGGGLRALANFMQRLLTPSEFDLLSARMFGNVSNADESYLAIAIPLTAVTAAVLWMRARRLNVLALGRDTSIRLGFNYRRELMTVLFLVSILMAVSTALVGPMTFFGFLVATLAYQATDTYDHRLVFPVAALAGFAFLTGAYFVLRHIFYAQGVVSILIEMVGGSAFLIVLLRKGKL